MQYIIGMETKSNKKESGKMNLENYRVDEKGFADRFQDIVKIKLGFCFLPMDISIYKFTPALAKRSGLIDDEDLEFGATVDTDRFPGKVLIVLHSHRSYSERRIEKTIYHEFAHLLIDQQGLNFSKSGHEAVADCISEFVINKGKRMGDIGWSRTLQKDKRAKVFVEWVMSRV